MTLSLSAPITGPPEKRSTSRFSEGQLAKQCVAGDQRAQRQLYDQYYTLVLGICRRYANHFSEDSDLLNQSFMRVFSKIDQFRSEGPLGAWIRQVCVRVCLSSLRKKQHQAYEALEDVKQSTASLPKALQRLAMDDLVALIQRLPALPRAVFNLHAVEGYTHSEIAKLLSIKEANSRYHLRQARLHLQTLINRQNQ